MIVLILERVSPSLRGELTRWFLEPKAGVFVGRTPASVHAKDGGCLMIHSSNTEQGYKIRSWGETSRSIEDFEGLFLVRVP